MKKSPVAGTTGLGHDQWATTVCISFHKLTRKPTEGAQPYSVGFFLSANLRRMSLYSLRPLNKILSKAAIVLKTSTNSIRTSAIMATPPYGRLHRDRSTETFHVLKIV